MSVNITKVLKDAKENCEEIIAESNEINNGKEPRYSPSNNSLVIWDKCKEEK